MMPRYQYLQWDFLWDGGIAIPQEIPLKVWIACLHCSLVEDPMNVGFLSRSITAHRKLVTEILEGLLTSAPLLPRNKNVRNVARVRNALVKLDVGLSRSGLQ